MSNNIKKLYLEANDIYKQIHEGIFSKDGINRGDLAGGGYGVKGSGTGKVGGERSTGQRATRSDAGQERQRTEMPKQERGTAGLSPKEQQRKAYKERKAREAAGQKKTQSSASLEKKATQLIKKPSEPQKSTYKKKSILDRKTRDWKGEGVTGRKERDAARNKEKSQSFSQKKADAISSFTKTHGRAPNKKEKMQIAGRIRGLTK